MAESASDACCTRCSAPLVTISFRQGSSTMTMTSCATCHRRTWRRDDEAVDLDGVLAALTDTRPGPPSVP
ncbi:MAG TPA: hypothetical protein VGR26_06030 [Acidimicrobiales bacterium]|nr:hypothetical protein [Acidimicrobiales bacterium]